VAPDQLARQLSDNGQLQAVAADVLRGNALSWLAAHARVVDEAGRPVDVTPSAAEAEGAALDADDEGNDSEGNDAED